MPFNSFCMGHQICSTSLHLRTFFSSSSRILNVAGNKITVLIPRLENSAFSVNFLFKPVLPGQCQGKYKFSSVGGNALPPTSKMLIFVYSWNMMKHVSKKVYSQVSISSGCEFQVIQKYSVISGGGGGAPDFFKCTLKVAKGPVRLFTEVKCLQAYSRVPKCLDFHMNWHIRL